MKKLTKKDTSSQADPSAKKGKRQKAGISLVIRRIVYLLFLAASMVLIGYRGGAGSFLIFWTLVLIPVLSLIYRKLILTGLEIRFEADAGSVVRGERLPCTLKLKNDSFLPIPQVRIHMTDGKVQFRPEEIFLWCSLKPGEEKVFSFEPLCRHLGRARVGAGKIVVPDYFGLIEICYERFERINILPRRQKLDSIQIAPPKAEERRKIDRSYFGDHVPDGQWRLYQQGDDLRRVNWKLSAREQKLIMKNLVPEPKSELILIPDGRECLPEGKAGWIAEDSVVEGTLAIADYFLRRGIALQVVPDLLRQIPLAETSAYERLYKMVSRNFFSGSERTDEVLTAHEQKNGTNRYILLTWEVDEAYIRRISGPIERGADITLVYMGEDAAAPALAAAQSKLSFYQVTSENDIFAALNGKSDQTRRVEGGAV